MTARERNDESGGSGNGNGSASETGQTAEGQVSQANGHPDHATPHKQGLGADEKVTQDDLKNVVKAVEETPLNVGDKWYLVDHIWWKKFVNASRNGYVEDVPTLSNEKISTLRKDAYYLKMGLNESIDYDALPESAFQFVHKHPGIENPNRDIIERLVVAKPDGKPYIEIYPRQISFVHSRDQKQSCTVVLSPSDTMETLRDKALTELSLNNHQLDDLRFYIKHLDRVELIDLAKSLDDYFDTAQEVIVDSIENGKWFYASPSAPQSSGSSNQGSFLSTSPFNGLGGSNRGIAYTKGACGLQNLGNTCFMASALQCLSNVPPLTEYFLSDDYLPDINATNPLGAQGELAKAYGELMKQMWSGEHSSVVPRRMKSIIGQFAPRFNGYQQQDAQELMAFLLDGLHEDLNRVRVKPYSEEDENMDKLPESEQAAHAWAAYKARNDSIVVDKVHGQLKSTLICPVCSKVSIKFDPFCYLSVPLPPKETSLKQRIIVTFPQQPKRRWAKFMITMTRSTVVDEIQSLILDSFKKSLPQEDEPHLIFFAVPLQGDDIRVLTADALISSVNPDIGSREVFAAAVKFDPERATTLIIKNQSTLARSLSLPLIFTVEDPATITRKFLLEHAVKATETMFLDKKKQQQQASGQGQTQQTGQQQSTDTPMDVDQNGEDEKANEENAEFEIMLKACHENGVTSELMPFHDEVIQQEIKKWQTALGGQTHAVAKTINIIFQWKDKQKFNAYRGNDLIERELSLPIRKDISLTECIDLFTRKEQLGEDDSWYCPQCKKHERATKKLDLWKLPEVLIVHLKRFQYSRFSRDKIDMNVSIPVMNFDLNDKVMNSGHEPVTYNLIAISNHMGGLGGGHYTATALNQTTGKWYDFNDSTATKTTTPDDPLVDRLPYILVYRRQSNSSPSPLSTATDLNIDMETEERPALSSNEVAAAKRLHNFKSTGLTTNTMPSNRASDGENIELVPLQPIDESDVGSAHSGSSSRRRAYHFGSRQLDTVEDMEPSPADEVEGEGIIQQVKRAPGQGTQMQIGRTPVVYMAASGDQGQRKQTYYIQMHLVSSEKQIVAAGQGQRQLIREWIRIIFLASIISQIIIYPFMFAQLDENSDKLIKRDKLYFIIIASLGIIIHINFLVFGILNLKDSKWNGIFMLLSMVTSVILLIVYSILVYYAISEPACNNNNDNEICSGFLWALYWILFILPIGNENLVLDS